VGEVEVLRLPDANDLKVERLFPVSRRRWVDDPRDGEVAHVEWRRPRLKHTTQYNGFDLGAVVAVGMDQHRAGLLGVVERTDLRTQAQWPGTAIGSVTGEIGMVDALWGGQPMAPVRNLARPPGSRLRGKRIQHGSPPDRW